MMAHTPGPWVAQNLEPGTLGCDWVDGPDRRHVAVCHEIVGNGPHGYSLRVDTDEIAANARLIAAAPEMYAELIWIAANNGECLVDHPLRLARVLALVITAGSEP